MNDTPPEPLVSVLVTSHNYARYVGECLKSVADQLYANYEVIVVDDGSTDESVQVIEDALLNMKASCKFVCQENAGQAAALNTGFAKSRGDILALLDSDDTWAPDKLAKMVAFVQAHPKGGVYQHQLETGHGPKRAGLVSGDVFGVWKEWNGGVFNIADAFDGISFSPFVPTSGLVFRREIAERVFPIPEEIRTCADAFLTRTSCAYGPLRSNPETLGVWRDHGDNAGHDAANDFGSFWEPVVLPALNRYYAANNLGLRLEFDAASRSPVPVSRMLGETTPIPAGETPRTYLSKGRSLQHQLVRDLVKSVIGR